MRVVAGKETLRYVRTAELIQAAKDLVSVLPPDLEGICGVPRSGLLPATVLAMELHLPLLSIDREQGLFDVGRGSRSAEFRIGQGARPGEGLPRKILVLDDTTCSGKALRKTQRLLERTNPETELLFGAVYPAPQAMAGLDFYCEILPVPHLLEWNLFNSHVCRGTVSFPLGIAVDFDGLLCENPPMSDRDEEPFLAWLENAAPLVLPRFQTVPAIVTHRRERWRQATLRWLDRWNVGVSRLVMAPDEGERTLRWKADRLKELGVGLYVESEAPYAAKIARLSGIPVLHPWSGAIFQ